MRRQAFARIDHSNQQGSMILLGLFATSFALLTFTSLLMKTLSEQVHTLRDTGTSAALYQSLSGLDLGFFEMNYGDNDFAPPWGTTAPNVFQRTFNPPTGGTVTVTVNKTLATWTITSVATALNSPISQTMRASITSPPPPSRYGYGMYAQNGTIALYTALPNTVLMTGYDSTNGNPSGSNKVDVTMGSSGPVGPYRQTAWAGLITPAQRQTASEGININGHVRLEGNLEVISPAAGETPLGGYSATDPGYALYYDGGAAITGTIRQSHMDRAPDFTPPAGTGLPGGTYSLDTTWFKPGGVTEWMFCPGVAPNGPPPDWNTVTATDVVGTTVIYGCSQDPANPYYCGKPFQMIGGMLSCDNLNSPRGGRVNVATGGDATEFPLRIAKAPPVLGGAAGKVLVFNETKLQIRRRDPAQGISVSIGSGGIQNQVLKNPGLPTETVNPAALELIGLSGQESTNRITTTTPLHMVWWDPQANVTIQSPLGGTVTIYGSLNVKHVETPLDGLTNWNFYWDKALIGAYSGSGTGVCDPCRPDRGTVEIVQ